MKPTTLRRVALAIFIVFLLTILAYPLIFNPEDQNLVKDPVEVEVHD